MTRRQFGGLVAKVLGAIGLVKGAPFSRSRFRVVSSGPAFATYSGGQTQHVQRYWRIVMDGEQMYLQFSDDARWPQ